MRRMIPFILAAAAVLNLVWLFGFDYKLPPFLTRFTTGERAALEEEAKEAEEKEEAEDQKAEVHPVNAPVQAPEPAAEETEEAPEEETEEEKGALQEREPQEDAGETPEGERVRTCSPYEGNTPNIRSGPGMDYEVIGMAMPGEVLFVRGDEEDGWLPIRTGDGLEGYVFSGMVFMELETQ